MTHELTREDRYIVIKRKDMDALNERMRARFDRLFAEVNQYLPKREFLVIESDWPEYEPAWSAIEARVTGKRSAQQVEPAAGWKLVPVEPTQTMFDAWVDAVADSDEHPVRAGYRAMLAAAPAAQLLDDEQMNRYMEQVNRENPQNSRAGGWLDEEVKQLMRLAVHGHPHAAPYIEPNGFFQVYRCGIKSRAKIQAEIPREKQGWWADVCPGETLSLRQAVQADIDRCCLNGAHSRNPDDYMCETFSAGALVAKYAIEFMNPEQNVFACVAAPQHDKAQGENYNLAHRLRVHLANGDVLTGPEFRKGVVDILAEYYTGAAPSLDQVIAKVRVATLGQPVELVDRIVRSIESLNG